MLRLALTGKPTLSAGDGRIVRLPRKGFVLAAWTALRAPDRRMVRRDAAALLWPDVDAARRAGNLRQLLARIGEMQQAEGFALFDFEDDVIALRDDAVTIDAIELLEFSAGAGTTAALRLSEVYAGDFLDGVDDGSPEFLDWLRPTRAHLRQRFIALAADALAMSARILPPADLKRCADRLLAADAENEVGHRALMIALLARADHRGADRVRARLTDLLRSNGQRPAPETTAVMSEVVDRLGRRGERRGRETEETATGIPGGARATRPDAARSRSPRVYVVYPQIADLAAAHLEWLQTLFDDVAIRVWQMRTFTLVRGRREAEAGTEARPSGAAQTSDYLLICRPVDRGGTPHLIVEVVKCDVDEIIWMHSLEFGEKLQFAAHAVVSGAVHHIEQCELRSLVEGRDQATAYQLALQGRRQLRALDLQSIRRARQTLRAALAIAPDHVPALAALSKSYRLEWLRLARGDLEELETALSFARRAVALEPNSAIGLHQLGICSVYKGDFDFGLDALGLAQRYQPFDEELIADFADGLIHAGQTAAAIDKLAPLLDAPFALTDHTLWVAASTFYLAGRYEDAIDILSRLNSKDTAHQLRAACHAMLSQFDEARRFVALTREILPEFSIAARLRAVPFRLADDLEHYRRGLRLAGFE